MAGKRETQKALRREAIYENAIAMFKQQGIEAMTMGALATACGIAVGTIYNYFESKNELVLALVVDADEKCIEATRKIIARLPKDPFEALAKIAVLQSRYSLDTLDKAGWRYVLAPQSSVQDAQFARRYIWTTSRLRDLFTETLSELKKRGNIVSGAPPEELAYYAEAMKHKLFHYYIADDTMTFAQHESDIKRGLRIVLKGHISAGK